jgi:hypothetical protein
MSCLTVPIGTDSQQQAVVCRKCRELITSTLNVRSNEK